MPPPEELEILARPWLDARPGFAAALRTYHRNCFVRLWPEDRPQLRAVCIVGDAAFRREPPARVVARALDIGAEALAGMTIESGTIARGYRQARA